MYIYLYMYMSYLKCLLVWLCRKKTHLASVSCHVRVSGSMHDAAAYTECLLADQCVTHIVL